MRDKIEYAAQARVAVNDWLTVKWGPEDSDNTAPWTNERDARERVTFWSERKYDMRLVARHVGEPFVIDE